MNKEYIGVDLHSTQVTVHRIIVDEDGMVERKNGQYTIERMETHFIASLRPGCAVCVEAGSGSHTLARMIVAAGASFCGEPIESAADLQDGKEDGQGRRRHDCSEEQSLRIVSSMACAG
jgi:hypothetical protein